MISLKEGVKSYLCRLNDKYRSIQMDYESLLPQIEYQGEIPKNIFQICLRGKEEEAISVIKSFANFDKELLDNICFLQNNNPDYNYQLICDKEAKIIIHKYYGQRIWEYYLRINKKYGAARADLLRYLVLYALGGVYLDLKSTVLYPLSLNIQQGDSFLIMYWDCFPGGKTYNLVQDLPNGELLTGFLVCSKGHPFMRNVIIQTLKNIDAYNPFRERTGTGILRITGNTMYSLTINHNYLEYHSKPNGLTGVRYEEAFHHFGYKLHYSGDYLAGDYSPNVYLRRAGLSNYRKHMTPVIASRNMALRYINSLYYLLAKCIVVFKTAIKPLA